MASHDDCLISVRLPCDYGPITFFSLSLSFLSLFSLFLFLSLFLSLSLSLTFPRSLSSLPFMSLPMVGGFFGGSSACSSSSEAMRVFCPAEIFRISAFSSASSAVECRFDRRLGEAADGEEEDSPPTPPSGFDESDRKRRLSESPRPSEASSLERDRERERERWR